MTYCSMQRELGKIDDLCIASIQRNSVNNIKHACSRSLCSQLSDIVLGNNIVFRQNSSVRHIVGTARSGSIGIHLVNASILSIGVEASRDSLVGNQVLGLGAVDVAGEHGNVLAGSILRLAGDLGDVYDVLADFDISIAQDNNGLDLTVLDGVEKVGACRDFLDAVLHSGAGGIEGTNSGVNIPRTVAGQEDELHVGSVGQIASVKGTALINVKEIRAGSNCSIGDCAHQTGGLPCPPLWIFPNSRKNWACRW